MKKHEFIEIINENRGIIRSLCKIYYTHSEDQEDAFQDVILQLWKSLDSFRGDSNISTWIYRVSLNTILANKRKDKKTIDFEPVDALHHNIGSVNADDNLELLYIIIQSLKDIEKAIVVLYLEGYSSKEIAEMLNMSVTNVTTRFNRIKAQLKVRYKDKPHAPK